MGIFCHFLVYMSLPAHFPIVRPGCTEVSTKFFDCFREACQPEGNVEKARTAVQRCEKELEVGLFSRLFPRHVVSGIQ